MAREHGRQPGQHSGDPQHGQRQVAVVMEVLGHLLQLLAGWHAVCGGAEEGQGMAGHGGRGRQGGSGVEAAEQQPDREEAARCDARKPAALALNTALAKDGVVVTVAPGAKIERPLHVAHVFAGATAAASYVRSLVVVGAGAAFTYAESFEGPDGLAYQANAATEFVVGDEAHLDVVRLQEDGAGAFHLATMLFAVGRESKVHTFSFSLGAGVARTSLYATLSGENSHVGFNGASLLKNRQHADTTLYVDHQVPGCESRELFKHVLDDSSRGVFQGKIVVRQAAQKTDGRMMSRALVLGDEAEMDNKPELEIFADDVQCGHGATCGAIDDELLFYLRARGIPMKEAQSLLVQAFVGEAVETVEHDGLREALVERAEAWLAARA